MENHDVNVISGKYRPRQFEFHPTSPALIFGTIKGNICTVDLENPALPIKLLGNFGAGSMDAILGICWMKKHQSRFISGSTLGKLVCGDMRYGAIDDEHRSALVKEYARFDRLTSVHVNSENVHLLVSGYSTTAHIYDIETGGIVAEYREAHQNHINISRFSNLSPNLFATSSFDGKAKAWDTRASNKIPIYEVKCNSGIVMINFSPDDTFMLASALDNEITQFLTVDGRKHTTFDVPKTGASILLNLVELILRIISLMRCLICDFPLMIMIAGLEGNYTRAYYSSTGAYIVTGACEESTVQY